MGSLQFHGYPVSNLNAPSSQDFASSKFAEDVAVCNTLQNHGRVVGRFTSTSAADRTRRLGSRRLGGATQVPKSGAFFVKQYCYCCLSDVQEDELDELDECEEDPEGQGQTDKDNPPALLTAHKAEKAGPCAFDL